MLVFFFSFFGAWSAAAPTYQVPILLYTLPRLACGGPAAVYVEILTTTTVLAWTFSGADEAV